MTSDEARPEGSTRACLVHDWLTGQRGGEHVLQAIAEHLPGAPIYSLFHFRGSVSPQLESHPIRTSFLQNAPGLERYYRWYLPLFPTAIEDFDLRAFDLVVSTSHCVAKGVIPAPGAHHVCYCHTPMRYAWDQEHEYFPRRKGPLGRLRGLLLSRLRVWDAASAPRVDTFVANSHFVAKRIRRYYGRTAVVVPPPVDVDFFTPGEGKKEAFALAVAALVPYKRIDLAIRATTNLGVPLVVVGKGPERDRLAAAAGSGVEFLEPVSRERLRDLYRRASFFLQPAVEDFGIATVEALACGTPVVAVGRGGVLDIVEPGVHGLLTPPGEDAGSLAAVIDKCRRMRFNSSDLRRRAEEFSAQRFSARLRPLLVRPPQSEGAHS